MNNDMRVWDLKVGDLFSFVVDPGNTTFEVIQHVPATPNREEYCRVKSLATGNVVIALCYEEVILATESFRERTPKIPDTVEVFLGMIGA
jgi:hypothetical protein